MSDEVAYWVNVRDRPGFLRRMMLELAGDTSGISLEGDLSRCRFPDTLIAPHGKWKTLTPAALESDDRFFVVLDLTQQAIDQLFKQIMAAGLKNAIYHVQIERDGIRELGAYDNFHPDCVVTGPGVSVDLLNELKKTNVIWDFALPTAGKTRPHA